MVCRQLANLNINHIIITVDLIDDEDIVRERKALAVRSNMLARRFARGNTDATLPYFGLLSVVLLGWLLHVQ